MSVNSAILDEQTNQPLPLNSLEKFLFDIDEIIEFSFICGSGYPGSTLGYASNSGRLFISDLRIIFLASPQLPFFQSFTCPFNKIYDLSISHPSNIFSFFKTSTTILSAKIIPQFELEDRISKDFSDLKIKLISLSSAKYIESLIKAHQFTGPVIATNSFDPLPLYSPPLPSYSEATKKN